MLLIQTDRTNWEWILGPRQSEICAVISCILLLCLWVLLVTDMLLTVEITCKWYVMIINSELGRSHGLTSVYYTVNWKDARRGSLSDVRILVHTISVSLKYRSAVWSVMKPVLVISWFHVHNVMKVTNCYPGVFWRTPMIVQLWQQEHKQFLAFVICSCLALEPNQSTSHFHSLFH